jgi:predicted Zn-dependent protease with MMP-like domain
MDKDAFERMVADALDAVPERFRPYLDTVHVTTLPIPSLRQRRALRLRPRDVLYGLYEGVPILERLADSGGETPTPPSLITVFRRPLAHDFRDPDELRDEVRRTVLHELAHHFGIDDDRLEELGAY